MILLRTCLLVQVVLITAACGDRPTETIVVSKIDTAASAAVAMPDTYSAEVASQILSAGGNAVDAAIAVGFTLAVTQPEAGNIGGGGFMLLWIDGQAKFMDYREMAPLAAHRDMYLDDNGDVIPGASTFGHFAVGVPGTVAGMWAAHQIGRASCRERV